MFDFRRTALASPGVETWTFTVNRSWTVPLLLRSMQHIGSFLWLVTVPPGKYSLDSRRYPRGKTARLASSKERYTSTAGNHCRTSRGG